jgi:CO dehydrogenase/acetyl-CoA synthase beta subunit
LLLPFLIILWIQDELSYDKFNINAENIYDRYREMDHLRYDISLKGYMMRAVSQYMREWSRISKEAINKGFSLFTLGGALIDKYRKLNYIDAVEIIFVTSSKKT